MRRLFGQVYIKFAARLGPKRKKKTPDFSEVFRLIL